MIDQRDLVTLGIRVAAAPINWGVTRLDPDNPPPAEMLDAVAGAGYAGCELGALGYLAGSLADLAHQWAPRGLDLVSAFVAANLAKPLSSADLQEIEAISALLAAAGSLVLLISDGMSQERAAVTGRVEQHPETWWSDDDWLQVRENIWLIRDRATAQGLALAFHPHAGTHVESGREIEIMLDAPEDDAPFLCLDTGHILIGGANPVDVLASAGDRVIHVHAKDVDGAILDQLRAGETTYVDAVRDGLYCDLGDGLVDWDGIARGLDQAGFAGWLVVEQDRHLTPGDPRPVASLRRNRDFVRRRFTA